ncbi:hypothetical protein [Deinococcus multiflagellatus]|uniref:Uncharacterized protein n=1 Tax=Deinococcus multiflagellatus TaxID=1656887 RepID=A0ABW1ZTC2_9DEIO|nr:hypothetical protein [Deinococcus multiflagellatus]MBZ9714427.1 hypothetical protein [Deinococcus multiflagellatus]
MRSTALRTALGSARIVQTEQGVCVYLPGRVTVQIGAADCDEQGRMLATTRRLFGQALDQVHLHRALRAFRLAAICRTVLIDDEHRYYYRVLRFGRAALFYPGRAAPLDLRQQRRMARFATHDHTRRVNTIHERVTLTPESRRADARFMKAAGRRFVMCEILLQEHFPF